MIKIHKIIILVNNKINLLFINKFRETARGKCNISKIYKIIYKGVNKVKIQKKANKKI